MLKNCWRCKKDFHVDSYPFKYKSTVRSAYCVACTDYQRMTRQRAFKARAEERSKVKAKSAAAKKRHKKNQRAIARVNGTGDDYASRNKWLKTIGFDTYADYLASNLWKKIKADVYRRKGKKCFLCGEPASEIHHNRYHLNDLRGKKLKFLNPICRVCHDAIEFHDGRKATLKQAKAAFKKLRQVFCEMGKST